MQALLVPNNVIPNVPYLPCVDVIMKYEMIIRKRFLIHEYNDMQSYVKELKAHVTMYILPLHISHDKLQT